MMKKNLMLASMLSLFAVGVLAQESGQPGDINKRNQQISRHCIGIVQNRLDYKKLPAADRASRDRANSAQIEECYQRYALPPTQQRS